jgi:mitogen-activated protein kinase kinase kinase
MLVANVLPITASSALQLDSWSVGALAYDVLCGRAPFAVHENITRESEKYAILNTDPAYPSGLSYEAVSFMKQAMEKDRQKRPSVKQLLVHPWFDSMCPRCPPSSS